MRKYLTIVAVAGMILACVSDAQASTMAWVTVGDPGNVDDTHYDGWGGVAETYNIGKYEVTNAQYCEFLNAVASLSDPHILHHPSMSYVADFGGITRSGLSGNYTYNTIAGRENMPVNFVPWYNTLRFANWMHNGLGSGDTEDGAYDMSLGASVVRKPGALVWLPSEDEWYKAAYYDPDKEGGLGYWDYPTGSDNPPTVEHPSGTDMIYGSANAGLGVVGDLTDVGAYTAKPSDSAYGTFDQGGNVWEWNEARLLIWEQPGDEDKRFVRGGSLSVDVTLMRARIRDDNNPLVGFNDVGFRVAAVPEPAMIVLLALGSLGVLRRRR